MLFRVPARAIFLIYFLCCHFSRGHAQDQRLADSLKMVYEEASFSPVEELEILRGLAFNEVKDYDLALQYADALVSLATEKKDLIYQYRGYLQKGRIYRLKGDLEIALQNLFRSVELAKNAGYVEGIGGAYINIADLYSINGNSANAIQHYNLAIDILRNTNDSITLATALLNAGDEYFQSGQYDSATTYFAESGDLFKKVNYPVGTAYNLGNIGMVYAEQGKDELAKAQINQAITILEDYEDYYAISDYLTYMSDIYFRQDDWSSALTYADRSLELARKYGLKDQISTASLTLSQLYEAADHPDLALKYFKDHVAFRDSVNNIQTVQEMADLRTDYEVSQKQIEVDLLNQQKKNQRIIVVTTIITAIMIAMLAIGLYRRNQYIQKTKKIIEEEKERSDHLLLNILPSEIADELKQNGIATARKYARVSVLFTDFKGFTETSEKLSAGELVDELNHCFKGFDLIMEKYGIEKIKTIGDAYMAAGGLSATSENSVRNTVRAALEMQEFIQNRQKEMNKLHDRTFEMRAGIHSGPVVAGIVGTKKFQYDIWGDTVNTASRMESNGAVGQVNISRATYEEIKDDPDFNFTLRGKIEVKGKGEMEMYFVSMTRMAPSDRSAMRQL